MGVHKLLLLFACVALCTCGKVAEQQGAEGEGEGAGGEQATTIRQALDALQAALASMLAAPRHLWAQHADKLAAFAAAIQAQINESKDKMSATLQQTQRQLTSSVEQFRATHSELEERVNAARRLLQQDTQGSAQHPETAEVARAFRDLAAAVQRAQEELARLWTPGPTSDSAASAA